MLFPKPKAMKLKEATNNNLKLPLAKNSDGHKSMKLIQIDEILPHFLINKMLQVLTQNTNLNLTNDK